MGYTVPKLGEKQPAESRLYDFNFAQKLASGETISTIVSAVSSPSGLTVGTTSIVGSKVRVRLSAGTTAVMYKITVTVTTSGSNTLETEANLFVYNR